MSLLGWGEAHWLSASSKISGSGSDFSGDEVRNLWGLLLKGKGRWMESKTIRREMVEPSQGLDTEREQEASGRAFWFGQLGDSGAVHSEKVLDSAAIPHIP